jgi:hypothetical protein
VRALLVRTPVHVVEVEAVEIEMVQILDQMFGPPVAKRRVETEPAEVFRRGAAVIEKLHHPLRVNRLERLAVVH